MPHLSFARLRSLAFALPVALFAVAPAVAAPPVYDRIVTVGDSRMATATLPGGPADPVIATSSEISQILALPSGQILATTRTGAGSLPQRVVLNELRADGSLRQIGMVTPFPSFEHEEVEDMAVDPLGRLYLLIAYTNFGAPSTTVHLVQVDPATAAVVSSRTLIVGGIAAAPDGLWALTGYQLRKLDPDTLQMEPPFGDLSAYGDIGNIESDSAGRIYFKYSFPCSPPCIKLGTIDPATGVAAPAPQVLHDRTPLMATFAIVRRCADSVIARCLQGGRFRAEVDFEAYDGAAGPARAATARSADTGIFSFFDPANWELMVKVLDGCAINSRYWVYSSASTDVEYTMTVTDTQTGAQQVYTNPLGQIALTVTDNRAFSCSP